MNCYCVEKEKEFVFCVENADSEYEQNIKDAWFEKVGENTSKPTLAQLTIRNA